MFSSLLLLAQLSLWALLCLGIWILVSAFAWRFPFFTACGGWLALAYWSAVVGSIFMLGKIGFYWPTPNHALLVPPVTIVVAIASGAVLLRATRGTPGSWWRDVPSFSLYFALAHGLVLLVETQTGAGAAMSFPWPTVWDFLGATPLQAIAAIDHCRGICEFIGVNLWPDNKWNAFSMVLLWLFPLGAPLAEIIFHSFKRAHKTNKTGSLL